MDAGNAQLGRLSDSPVRRRPPSTRYQGSKFKLLDFIGRHVGGLQFDTALDAFGGTGCVSYLLKAEGKSVTYNDYLEFNAVAARALIENPGIRLPLREIAPLTRKHRGVEYDDFIAREFSDVFFTDRENEWLDVVVQNVRSMTDKYRQAIAYYALFQSCIAKRPYNLFHRKNLYMRTAEVTRSFGNKATWDTPFEVHFRRFVKEANDSVFESRRPCRALCRDALQVPGDYDLVYIDTPYVNGRGVGVDYLDFYHFLEGLVDYPNWSNRVNRRKKHRPLLGDRSPWSDPKRTLAAFRTLFERYADSLLVVSYRSDGIPSEDELARAMRRVKGSVKHFHFGEYKYALSTSGNSQEVLLVGE